jgi:hypothetical protein
MTRILGLTAVAVALTACGWQTRADEKPKPDPKGRFDLVVREDLFAGFGGDAKALERGLTACDEALAKDPKNAEAMVWRGAGRVFQAGQLFQAKKTADGLKMWTSGLKDMDDAVKLEPKNVGVRIPRAAVLMPTSRFVPGEQAKPLLETVRGDFEAIYELQKNDLDKLGTHPKGELRMGLAEVYRRLDQADKSKAQLDAVVKELPDSKYATRAKEWLAAKPDAKLYHDCIGCHTK